MLFKNASFVIQKGSCTGIIGQNGCGKTTLFSIIKKKSTAEEGSLSVKDGLRIKYLNQSAIDSNFKNIDEFILHVAADPAIEEKMVSIEAMMADPSFYSSPEYGEKMEEYGMLQSSLGLDALKRKTNAIDKILSEINMPEISALPDLSLLSGGERQKLAVAAAIANPQECDLLLLDEPTNHLDIESIEWLEEQLAIHPATVMLISHDRYLLSGLVDGIIEFRGSEIEIYSGSFEQYEEARDMKDYVKQQAYKKSNAEVRRQEKIISVMAGRNKYDRQIKSRLKRMEKVKVAPNPVIKEFLLRMKFEDVEKHGKHIASGEDICKSFGDKTVLKNAGFEINVNSRIGLIGPNGCGKTTFLKMLIGEQKPDAGEINLSSTVRAGYFDQGHISLELKNTLLEEVQRGHPEINENSAKALLGQFGFRGEKIFFQVKILSGGEKARLAFLRLLLEPYNFLILDEPTNHMDISSKKAIESALNAFTGTVLLVSHDRLFLDNTVDTIFHMHDGIIESFPGNYSQFKGNSMARKEYVISRDGIRYRTVKSFTEWSTRTKYKPGDIIIVNSRNRKVFSHAIDIGDIIEVKQGKK